MSYVCNRCEKEVMDDGCNRCHLSVQIANSVKGDRTELLHKFVADDPVLSKLRYDVEFYGGYTEVRTWIRLKEDDDILHISDPEVIDISKRLGGDRLREFMAANS